MNEILLIRSPLWFSPTRRPRKYSVCVNGISKTDCKETLRHYRGEGDIDCYYHARILTNSVKSS